jgi:hypothetical protein
MTILYMQKIAPKRRKLGGVYIITGAKHHNLTSIYVGMISQNPLPIITSDASFSCKHFRETYLSKG